MTIDTAHQKSRRPTGSKNEKDRQDYLKSYRSNFLNLMLCFVFTLLPYPHKAGRFQRFLIIRVQQRVKEEQWRQLRKDLEKTRPQKKPQPRCR